MFTLNFIFSNIAIPAIALLPILSYNSGPNPGFAFSSRVIFYYYYQFTEMTFIEKQALFIFLFYYARLMFLAPLTFKLYVFHLFLCCPFLKIIYSPNSPKSMVVNIYIYICLHVCVCLPLFTAPPFFYDCFSSFFFFFCSRLATHATAPRPFPPHRWSHARETPHQQVRGGDDYDDDIIDRFLATVCPIVASCRRAACVQGVCVYMFFL